MKYRRTWTWKLAAAVFFLVALVVAAVPARSAPLKWQPPQQWNNGAPLPPSALRYYNVWCGPVEGKPEFRRSVDAPATRVELNLTNPQWCAVTAVAETEDGSLRESSYSDFVWHDPAFAPAAVNGVTSEGAPIPPKCALQMVCPVTVAK